jgi:ribosome biogenesis GTPase A
MARSLREINDLQHIDATIQVIDARAIITSANNNILEKNNKPFLTIALKNDLADVEKNTSTNIIFSSIKEKNIKKIIINKLQDIFSEKILKLKKKGIVKPQFYILVIGMPNVGKSSLISVLSNTKLVSENRPGVTRKNQLVKLNDMFYIYDTPGIMTKKINTNEEGYKLCLLNIIKKNIVPIEEITNYAFNFFMKNYTNVFLKMFENDKPFKSFDDFLSFICERFKFIKEKNKPDFKRAHEFLFNKFIGNTMFKVNYDKK